MSPSKKTKTAYDKEAQYHHHMAKAYSKMEAFASGAKTTSSGNYAVKYPKKRTMEDMEEAILEVSMTIENALSDKIVDLAKDEIRNLSQEVTKEVAKALLEFMDKDTKWVSAEK